jgi:hypothetical protein
VQSRSAVQQGSYAGQATFSSPEAFAESASDASASASELSEFFVRNVPFSTLFFGDPVVPSEPEVQGGGEIGGFSVGASAVARESAGTPRSLGRVGAALSPLVLLFTPSQPGSSGTALTNDASDFGDGTTPTTITPALSLTTVSFGDATDVGSEGGRHLHSPIVGMAVRRSGT